MLNFRYGIRGKWLKNISYGGISREIFCEESPLLTVFMSDQLISNDWMNYQRRGLRYPPKAEADNTDTRFDNSRYPRKPNSIIVSLYIF